MNLTAYRFIVVIMNLTPYRWRDEWNHSLPVCAIRVHIGRRSFGMPRELLVEQSRELWYLNGVKVLQRAVHIERSNLAAPPLVASYSQMGKPAPVKKRQTTKINGQKEF